ncbi:DUF4064 domain-containing protein [Staphylococcus pettenkoferi]|uniref:DUF4064 domain-containing protein n=2 Tax=Staphylococcus TaxID=1279 RepID=A0A2N6QHC4_9STAP|nr:DUF4064 domain-containing protein [Staphylococcus pettenkoferi]
MFEQSQKGVYIIMKYKSERVSSWVAVGLMGLALLGCFLGTIFFAIMGNQTKEGLIATDAFSYSEADDFITLWGPISVFFLISSIILIIFGIIGSIWIGKKTKAAAIMLLVIGILSIVFNFWPIGLIWIIVSINLFRKHSKEQPSQGPHQGTYDRQQDYTNEQDKHADFLEDDARRYTKEVKDDPYKY